MFFNLIFFNKHTIFHYNKLKLQQNDINTKRYTRLKFKQRLLSVKTQKNKTTTKTKQATTTTATTTKTPTETYKGKTKQNKNETQPIFPNDFSHVVYLLLHQNLLSTVHLRY